MNGCFGLLKNKFRSSDCYAMEQLADVVDRSSQTTSNAAQLFAGSSIMYRSWNTFLADHFKPIKGIRELHHLVFNGNKPGLVQVRKSLGAAEEQLAILSTRKEAVVAAGLSPILPSARMSATRVKYLYKNVRAHVPQQFQDILCPAPASESE